jgi:hypothetical protein
MESDAASDARLAIGKKLHKIRIRAGVMWMDVVKVKMHGMMQ